MHLTFINQPQCRFLMRNAFENLPMHASSIQPSPDKGFLSQMLPPKLALALQYR